MRQHLRWAFALCVCVGCDERAAPFAGRVRGCVEEGDHWEPVPDGKVSQLADSLDLSSTGGLARLGDRIVVFDDALPRVTVLEHDGRLLRHFGRAGDGPGELSDRGGVALLRLGRTPGWLATYGGDTIVIFDGRRVQLFSERGDQLGVAASATDFVAFSGARGASGIRVLDGSLLIDVLQMGSVIRGLPRTFALLRLRKGAAPDTLVSLRLADVPRAPRGGVYSGPREAMPLWDVMGDCYVIFDGWSPHILVGRLGQKGTDTVRFDPPTRPPPREEDLSKYGVPDQPDPARPLLVRRMVAARDGWLWFLPNQPDGLVGEEIVRLSLLTGEQRVDTVPHFPALFESGGSYLAIQDDQNGAAQLVRVLLGVAAKRSAP